LYKLSKEARDDIIEAYYKDLKSAIAVAKELKLNNRTVLRALKKRGYDLSKSPKMLIKPVKMTNLKTGETFKFRSQSKCAAYFYDLDKYSRTELLSKPSTFNEGLNFKLYSMSTYRQAVSKAIRDHTLYRNYKIEEV
jgi:hypothetical protein